MSNEFLFQAEYSGGKLTEKFSNSLLTQLGFDSTTNQLIKIER